MVRLDYPLAAPPNKVDPCEGYGLEKFIGAAWVYWLPKPTYWDRPVEKLIGFKADGFKAAPKVVFYSCELLIFETFTWPNVEAGLIFVVVVLKGDYCDITGLVLALLKLNNGFVFDSYSGIVGRVVFWASTLVAVCSFY